MISLIWLSEQELAGRYHSDCLPVFFETIGLIGGHDDTLRKVECLHGFQQSVVFAGEVQFGYLVADLDGAAHFAFLADYEVAFPLDRKSVV